MKKIIVTGGAGFIGSHTVVELYNAGYEPIIIDNFSNSQKSVLAGLQNITGSAVKLFEGDCCNRDLLKKIFTEEENIDGIIHFAAHKAVSESVQNPLKYYRNNLNSLMALLEIMQNYNCSNFVFSSSCTVYGQPDKLPVTEVAPKKPAESPYGNTKKICEDIIEDVIKSNAELKIISLRYFNPIGAHASSLIGELPLGVPDNLVPYITQTAAGIREKLTIFGNDYDTSDGTCVRDYIHVIDLAKAHVKAFEYLNKQEDKTFYDVFNIGTGHGNSVKEIVETFQSANNVNLNYVVGKRREGDIEKIFADVDKATTLLNWKTELSLEQALIDAWNWQKALRK
ncbi:UDP-glucose 4-epimerase GalE [Candidatus Parcubacteria bacterium]|nr:UDP-glucose 4-epimerase GalE [Candidatus Parcubacteria bacterium]